MICNFYSEIARTAMNCQPTFPGIGIFTIFNKMITAAECAETLVKDSFLKFYAAAEVSNETCIYTRSLIDKIGSRGAGFLILRVEIAEQLFFI